MRTLLLSAVFLGFAPFAAADDDFVPLFDGKSLAGWKVHAEKPLPAGHWSAKDGVLSAGVGSSYAVTTKEFGDFVLKLEWRIPKGGNSGVFLRVPPDSKKQPYESGLEVQILDDDDPMYKGKLKPYQYNGSIYYFVPAAKHPSKGPGEWNAYEITCKGDRVKVICNGELVTDGDAAGIPEFAAKPKKGLIGLQNHGTAVEFRNVSVRELK